jgi:hypothetical protein
MAAWLAGLGRWTRRNFVLTEVLVNPDSPTFFGSFNQQEEGSQFNIFIDIVIVLRLRVGAGSKTV